MLASNATAEDVIAMSGTNLMKLLEVPRKERPDEFIIRLTIEANEIARLQEMLPKLTAGKYSIRRGEYGGPEFVCELPTP